MSKRAFDIPEMMRRIRAAVRPFAKAAMFELAEDGFDSPFEQLVACIISIRTRDEAMIEIARRLFARARTPAAIAAMPVEELDALITPSTFHEAKAAQLVAIARLLERDHGGALPCDYDTLLTFRGVGPKCANLVLGIACGQPRIGVDIHVHRVTNRWGYVREPTPEKTTLALEESLPRRYWVEINRLLVPFGKHICTGRLPKCSTCPVLEYCRQVGVTEHR
ncbi:MAG TPA: endonuclease III [Gemmatimonadaceae bacterium]|nr:endonuclease III [Gemmatimonadaceae bacterium]